MGNEGSQLKGLEINEKAIEITDFWGHYRATVHDSASFFNLKGYGSISVFKSESPVLGAQWIAKSPLEKCAINLMKYRHPNIMRYIWHWQDRSIHYLATEPVQPLSQVLSSQDTIQICVGLHQIIQALDFLHSKGLQSHNNISIGSIYVMPDGCWRLGGMEFLRSFSEMTTSYLRQIKTHRYDKAVDPNEDTCDDLTKVDQYAFCSLVEEVFKGKNDDSIPHLLNFQQYCKRELQNPVSKLRPTFSSLLQNDLFNHEFVAIHTFLTSLPVKTEHDKTVFFSNLLEKLKVFNEETVAKQLGGPLLSRLVLLNPTARDKLLPYILMPKDNNSPLDHQGLFSFNVFKHRVTPQLLRMFRVRDSQVRLLLLKYFKGYMLTFSKEDLIAHVLPELLLGIKDTDDTLVSITLYCLADLIPILGASTVIGAKRSKLFTDGRPMHSKSDIKLDKIQEKNIDAELPVANNRIYMPINHSENLSSKHSNISNLITEDNILLKNISFGSKDSIEIENNAFLLERPSPDGGEDLGDEVILKIKSNDMNDSDEDWSDWEQNENKEVQRNPDSIIETSELNFIQSLDNINNDSILDIDKNASISLENGVQPLQLTKLNIYTQNDTHFLQKAAIDAKSKKLTDISELDIKNQKYVAPKKLHSMQKDEFDFFTDMEPVIEKASVLTIKNPLENVQSNANMANDQVICAKLNFNPTETDQTNLDQAWGNIDWNDD